MSALLSIRDLEVHFRTRRGAVRAVDKLSLDIGEGETVALVGESGSGKSTAALAILGLIPSPPGKIANGEIMLRGHDLTKLSQDEIRKVRGRSISMIFQDPMMALNPVHSIGRQIGEVLMLHLGMTGRQAAARAVELLHLVRVPAPKVRIHQYPHNLSGGMRQRVMIAMALACNPKLLIADEPTTALDVTIQAQVLALINDLKQQLGMSVLLITHDLGVVAETAQRVVVMYAGRTVEEGPVSEVFKDPRHPYTQGLMTVSRWETTDGQFMPEIRGTVPSHFDMPPGCSFAPRCDRAIGICRLEHPRLQQVETGRPVSCFVAQGRAQ